MNKMIIIVPIVLVVVAAFSVVALLNLRRQDVETPSTFEKGVSLSPKSFQSSDFTEFFEMARQTGRIVAWAGDWNDLGTAGKSPDVVAQLASTYDYGSFG